MKLKEWLEKSFRAHADRIALSHGADALTYREVERRSGAAARNLLGRGVAAGDRVALRLGKSLDCVCAIFGLLRIGAAYVPLDPGLPEPRRLELLRLCAPKLEIGEDTVAGLFAPAGDGALPELREDAPAYVLFTSGSTGGPKAVEMRQSAAFAFADWAAGAAGLRAEDSLLSTSALSFDLSTFDFFAGIGSGARVVLAPSGIATFPASLSQLLEREKVSVWYAVPYSISLVAEHGDLASRDLSAFRALLSAGDRFPLSAALAFRERTGCRLFNFYGPTETNVCTAFEVPAGWAPSAPVPIGHAAAGDRCRIRRDDGTLADEGRGELLVSGPTLMSGYRDGAKLGTAVFRREDGAAYYPTGDLVERKGDGPFFFLGRADDQVKRWGYRVSPAETEEALGRIAGVGACAVVGVPDPKEGHALHAFVVPETGVALAEEDILDALRSALPSQFIPATVRFVESMPLGTNGKIDRAALKKSLRS